MCEQLPQLLIVEVVQEEIRDKCRINHSRLRQPFKDVSRHDFGTPAQFAKAIECLRSHQLCLIDENDLEWTRFCGECSRAIQKKCSIASPDLDDRRNPAVRLIFAPCFQQKGDMSHESV